MLESLYCGLESGGVSGAREPRSADDDGGSRAQMVTVALALMWVWLFMFEAPAYRLKGTSVTVRSAIGSAYAMMIVTDCPVFMGLTPMVVRCDSEGAMNGHEYSRAQLTMTVTVAPALTWVWVFMFESPVLDG